MSQQIKDSGSNRNAKSINDENKTPKMTSLLEQTLNTRLITNFEELCRLLALSKPDKIAMQTILEDFPLLLPESILDRIKEGDAEDPVLQQFLPKVEEREKKQGFSDDPLCEFSSNNPNVKTALYEQNEARNLPNCILQKYAGRALVLTSNLCAAHCRFCFRRRLHSQALYPPTGVHRSKEGSYDSSDINAYFEGVFRNLKNNSSFKEIIFSGGDPLTLPNDFLKRLLDYIKNLKNVNRVRFHSRIPVLSPDRIDSDFPNPNDYIDEKTKRPLLFYLVVHVNSSNEINDKVANKLLELRNMGYILLSQSTLLKGINDTCEKLTALLEKLVDVGVTPYYLHQLDRVQGAAHFEVSVSKGLELIEDVSKKLPGYAIPTYAREIPGRPMKINLRAEPEADF